VQDAAADRLVRPQIATAHLLKVVCRQAIFTSELSAWRAEMARSRVELFEQIRRDRRVEGLSIRELAERHGVHRRTVRPARASRPSTLLRQPDLNS